MNPRSFRWLSLLALAAVPLAATLLPAAPQAPAPQSFVVLHATHVTGPSEAMTPAEANCVINGSGDAATMQCKPMGVSAQNSYHFNVALVVDPQGAGYVIACRMPLVGNYWCKSFSSVRTVHGNIVDGALQFSDGSKVRKYLILASRNVGTVTPVLQAAPAPAKQGRASRSAAAPISAPPAAPAAESSASCAPTFSGACVTITSEPAGADIYVDGKFMGNTPSVLALPIGSRQIRVEAAGRKPWTRALEATAGSRVSLRATLDPAN